MIEHTFGGSWTEEKLTRLRKYLEAYTVIFTRNPKAAHFRRVYVDAFAGTGIRNETAACDDDQVQPLFDADPDASSFMKGSTRVALEIQPPFDQYLFIEKDKRFARELQDLTASYPKLAGRVTVRTGDANEVLVSWVSRSSWASQRAVVFLDPYGMQVQWPTLEALAATKAVDLWILFPLGQGVNRLLTRNAPPPEAWAHRLTKVFGTDAWKEAFYTVSRQGHLFDEEPHLEKSATFESIAEFFLKRLDTIFERVAPNPLVLRNSRNNPIFLLCFAAANKVGSPTAVKIARDLLGR